MYWQLICQMLISMCVCVSMSDANAKPEKIGPSGHYNLSPKG